MNFKDKRVLVVDAGGLFVSFAELLSRHFGEVGYFVNWESGFPDGRELIVGSGIPNVNREKYLWPVIDSYDLIVFPDVWSGDLQEHLRSQGLRVWGSGMGSDLELARWKTKQRFPELNLPVNHAEQVVGTDALRVYLKEHKKQFVKVSAFRGLGETWFAEDYEMAKGQIDELDAKHGPMAAILPFIVEDSIPDATEVGYDGFCIDGEFPNTAVFGVERKDQAYFGKSCKYDALPQLVRDTNTKLAQAMPPGYRQFFSTEIREKDGKGYVIDLTARHPSPAGEVICEMFTNLPDILWFGAEGKLIEPIIEEPYGAQIILTSEWAEEHYQPVRFPAELRPFVRLYNHCIVNGVDYTVPQMAKMKQVGSVIALGKTPEAAVQLCKERAEQIKGYDLETEADALDKAVAEMEEVSAD